jgi:hypothetical protein
MGECNPVGLFHGSAMLTGRPERRTLRVRVPVRELEARRRKGRSPQKRFPVSVLWKVFHHEIVNCTTLSPVLVAENRARLPAPRNQKHHASPPSKREPSPSGSWAWPVHSVSSARLVFLGVCLTSARRGTDGPVRTFAITAWSSVTVSFAWRPSGYARRAILPGLSPLGD